MLTGKRGRSNGTPEDKIGEVVVVEPSWAILVLSTLPTWLECCVCATEYVCMSVHVCMFAYACVCMEWGGSFRKVNCNLFL